MASASPRHLAPFSSSLPSFLTGEALKTIYFLNAETIFMLIRRDKRIDRDGATIDPLLYALRTFWRITFYIYSIGFAYWLIKNLLIGNYVGQIKYFLPASLFLLLLALGVFLLAFRSNDEWFSNFNLSFVGIVLPLTICEAGIRVADRLDPIFRPVYLEDRLLYKGKDQQSFSPYRPGSIGSTHGYAVRINAWGFRGAEWTATKPANTFRILVLGDSLTFGQGVEESAVYTSMVEKALLSRFPGQKVEVINTGVQGYSAVDEMNLLNKIGDLLKPDLVLVGFYENDLRDGPQLTEKDRNRWAIPFPDNIKETITSHSKLLMWLSMKFDQALLTAGIRSDDSVDLTEQAYNVNSEEWKQFVSAYRQMYQWTRTHHIPPPLVGLFLVTPYFDPQRNDFIRMTPDIAVQVRHVKQVQQALGDMGILTVDYLPLFQRHNKQNMMVSKWDGHPNALAHRLYAEGFVDSIISLQLVH
jgi:lysophospholipase L1-like esterase